MFEPTVATGASSSLAARTDLSRLTSLRAFAALFVFGFHAFKEFDVPIGQKLFGLGYTGVAFFFVLSGFVLTWSAQPGSSTSRFYWRRFARIWPLHAVVGLAGGVVYGFHDAWATVEPLLLVQAWDPRTHVHYGLVGASWSLSAEFFFYLTWPVAAVVAARAWGRFSIAAIVVFLAGGAATAAAVALSSPYVRDALYVNPAVRWGEFLIGVALGAACRHQRLRPVRLSVALVFAVVSWELTRKLFERDAPLPDFALVPAFALVIWAAAHADLSRRAGILRMRPFIYAGEISFAFYLVHQFAISAVVHLHAPEVPRVLLSLFGGVALAVLGHELIEKPANNRLRRFGNERAASRRVLAEAG